MSFEKIVREPECKAWTSLSRCTRCRLEKCGEFPKRRQITKGTVGWLASEIERWILDRGTKEGNENEQ